MLAALLLDRIRGTESAGERPVRTTAADRRNERPGRTKEVVGSNPPSSIWTYRTIPGSPLSGDFPLDEIGTFARLFLRRNWNPPDAGEQVVQ